MNGLAMLIPVSALSATTVPVATLEHDTHLTSAAKTARTACEHAAVAYRFQTRALALESKATAHASEAARLANRFNSMAHKWAAMANGPAERERAQARLARQLACRVRTVNGTSR
jgi:hypothetical protein